MNAIRLESNLERKLLFTRCSVPLRRLLCWSHLQPCVQMNLRMDSTPPFTYNPGSRHAARSTRPSTTSRHRYPAAARGHRIGLPFEGRAMTPCFLPLFSALTSSRCLVATLWLSLTRVRMVGGRYKETASAGWFQDLTSQKCDPNGRLLLQPHSSGFDAVVVFLSCKLIEWTVHPWLYFYSYPPPPLFLCVANIGIKVSEEIRWKLSRPN